MAAEPLTPVAVEAKRRQPVNDLARAQAALRQARDLEVDARHEYDRARRRALLSEKSPKVTGGGYTVAEQAAGVEQVAWVEQAAWVEQQCADLKLAADKATMELAGELRIDRGTGGGTMLEAERRADRKCCLRIAVACSPARWTPLGRASPG